MTNLVPEKRMDRNGVMVTRHVKASSSKAPAAIPAPTTDAAHSGFRPTKVQTRQWDMKLSRYNFPIRRELHEVLPAKTGSIEIQSNDVDTYSMLSILIPQDALAFMERGIKSIDKARAFIEKHGIQHIEVDAKAFTDEALRRGIPARSYLHMCEKINTRNSDPTKVLDAVEVYTMRPLSQQSLFYMSVMSGNINLDDIKTIGAELISQHPYSRDIHDMLAELKRGDIPLNAHDFKALLERCVEDGTSLSDAVDMAGKFGLERFSQVTNLRAASSMSLHVGTKYGDDIDQAFARVQHFEHMAIACELSTAAGAEIHWPSLPFATSDEMFNAGIGPETAVECVLSNMSADQYLAIRDHDIAPSVSGGWL